MMKRLGLVLLVGLMTGCVSIPVYLPTDEISAGHITENYDKFTDYTTVKIEHMIIKKTSHGYNGLELTAYADKDKFSKSHVVLISLMSQSSGWKYLKCHRLIILADGDPVTFHKTKHDGNVGSGYVLEFISLTLKSKEFLKMANSKTLEGRLCRDEFSFTLEQIDQFKKLATMANL